MGGEALLLEIGGGVARIRFNRPDTGNALNAQAASLLSTFIDTIEADPGVRVVVLSAAGKHFCAGGDITEFLAAGDDLARLIADELVALNATLLRIAALPIPVVTALNGPVAGGGIGLALSADILVAAESARYRSGYSAIGLSPDAGTSFYLVRALGATRAKELMFLNRSLPAREALAAGLVNRVVPDADLERATEEIVAELLALPAGSLAAIKTLVREESDGLLERSLARERELMVRNAEDADVREGIAAFRDRRAPRFGEQTALGTRG